MSNYFWCDYIWARGPRWGDEAVTLEARLNRPKRSKTMMQDIEYLEAMNNKLRSRATRYEEALRRITTDHQSYDDPENGSGPYGVGVTDGHRCAAAIARDALTNQ